MDRSRRSLVPGVDDRYGSASSLMDELDNVPMTSETTFRTVELISMKALVRQSCEKLIDLLLFFTSRLSDCSP